MSKWTTNRRRNCKLFWLVTKRKLSVHVVRVLINIYTNTNSLVLHGTSLDLFIFQQLTASSRVVLSALWGFIDDLWLAISKSGVGCIIGNHFVGAFAYADDLVLVASHRQWLELETEWLSNFVLYLTLSSAILSHLHVHVKQLINCNCSMFTCSTCYTYVVHVSL